MARPLRAEYPDAYYHVINRGNAGENRAILGTPYLIIVGAFS